MRKPLVIAGILSLMATAVLADMYQDAGNAKLPDARNNLELGTVKSEGGNPPNADTVTRFYTDDGTRQFEVAGVPFANEYAVEQAGLGAPGGVGIGQGATRLCTAPYSNNAVNCNYVAGGRDGKHIFGSGAGKLLELGYSGTGAINAFPKFYAADDAIARLYAETPGAANAALYLKAKGTADVVLGNDNAFNIAHFLGPASASGYFTFTAPTLGGPATIASTGTSGVQVQGQVLPMRQTLTAYTIPASESGTQYHNQGAAASSTYTLPAAAQGLNYCFVVDAAFAVIVKAGGSDKIAIAAANSAAGGQVSASAPFASLCLVAYRAGQWVARSTADKTQWTVT